METSKKELREKAGIIYNHLSADYKNEASDTITKLLFKVKQFKEAESILIYISTFNEPSSKKIINEILKCNKSLYVPVCIDDNTMQICKITEDTRYSENKYRIKEPENPEFTDITPDLVIMPCIAADKNNNRLGHGKGFYDRYLYNKRINTICLCFSKLIFDNIPQDEYDIKPDIIITENGFIY